MRPIEGKDRQQTLRSDIHHILSTNEAEARLLRRSSRPFWMSGEEARSRCGGHCHAGGSTRGGAASLD
jgi:hypothetical protein